jgi:nucleoside-diphosphate-sugar epimerase
MVRNVLITGVNGFIGRNLALRAISEGFQVFGISRGKIDTSLLSKGVKDWSSVNPVTKIDALIHLSGNPRLGNGASYQNNTELTKEAIYVFNQFRTQNAIFVFASSISAMDYPWLASYRELSVEDKPFPRSSYGKSKLESEVLLENHLESSLCIARLGMVVGSNMRPESHILHLSHILKKWKLISFILRYSSGRLPIVHIDDSIKALLDMATGKIPSGKYLVIAETIPVSKVITILTGLQEQNFSYILPAWINSLFPPKIATVLGPVLTYKHDLRDSNLWAPSIDIEKYLDSWRE